MSLVGPRPHQPDEIAQYEKHHKKVLAIKAGATGLAQVSGSSDLPFDEEVNPDRPEDEIGNPLGLEKRPHPFHEFEQRHRDFLAALTASAY